jgi:Ca2+-transporting ATPase
MTVTNVCAGGQTLSPEKLSDKTLLLNFCVNSTADVVEEGKALKFIGNPTECALLIAAKKAGTDYSELRKSADIAHVYSFSSETKNMTTVVKNGDVYEIYTKGSPEKILAMCNIGADEKAGAEKQITAYQEKAARVIGFAHKTVSALPDFEDRQSVESGLSFDGFVTISDPLRADVYDAVKECKRAGIQLKMLTGDNIVTATAIANELQILSGGGIAVEAKDLADLDDAEFNERIKTVCVIARSTPIIKMRVVKALKGQGNVVAVTGDGINDAPAIKAADVGIAMGITGTEVSKEASDIVLLDDSFSTIATSVKWGRGIYENFQRFIQFQLTVNLSSVIVVLVSIMLGLNSPFTALQLLWINLIMDGPPALTLGLEPIRGDLMSRSPTKRNANIVSKSMLSRILINGLYLSAMFLFQQNFNFLGATAEQMPTVLFALFALFQLFNSFNSRELGDTTLFRHIHKNKWFLIVIIPTFILQVVVTQFGGAFFGTVALPAVLWLKIFALAASIIVLGELTKLIIKLHKRVAERRRLRKRALEEAK